MPILNQSAVFDCICVVLTHPVMRCESWLHGFFFFTLTCEGKMVCSVLQDRKRATRDNVGAGCVCQEAVWIRISSGQWGQAECVRTNVIPSARRHGNYRCHAAVLPVGYSCNKNCVVKVYGSAGKPSGNENLFNLLKPAGYMMHQQFNVQQLYALPTLYLCVLYLSENKQRLVPLTA